MAGAALLDPEAKKPTRMRVVDDGILLWRGARSLRLTARETETLRAILNGIREIVDSAGAPSAAETFSCDACEANGLLFQPGLRCLDCPHASNKGKDA